MSFKPDSWPYPKPEQADPTEEPDFEDEDECTDWFITYFVELEDSYAFLGDTSDGQHFIVGFKE